ncbi:FadR/GntR family transcriptional regulator [Lederbergia wuyishanensis]|uniref:DNA-binding FadR family transcriptional regulator n=1 Tax=Lederbergia wuyishanensis TaxID=1347903 RepID=A0ABU0D5Z5_9BACI|nr:FadR/GntR family transcriptional regulator [Lederbergia wuyishanensis]MCJ8008393.1 FadR family transcriptional regulator [Lederbergia wuyishanensis]MDQ0343810.1 DNA-binding FadR family transcriptional regulator [Lederbergia wuyishanensis]
MIVQRKQTLSEVVSERIKSYISENKCQPGDRLPTEKEIIETLGVSRTIVREALKTLQSQGIIEIKQGLGIFVKEIKIQSILRKISPFLTIDKKKFKEVIDTRIILELGAISLAIEHYDTEKLERMSFWNEALLEKAKRGEKPKNEDLNFHRSLIKATGNETFVQLSSIISEYFNMNHLEQIVELDEYVASYKEHKLVVDSILAKDVETAKQAMETHLNHLYDLIDDWEED